MLMLIDGNSIYARMFFAFKHTQVADPHFAVYKTVSYINLLINQYEPTSLIVAFDSAHLWRKDRYPEYKGKRKPKPEGYKELLASTQQVMKLAGFSIMAKDGYEADDCIATVCVSSPETILIITGDHDLLQLVDARVSVELFGFDWETKRQKRDRFTDDSSVARRLGVSPSQVVDFKALAGDTSDNLPHPYGIGAVKARELLLDWGDLDEVYENLNEIRPKLRETLERDRDKAYLGQELARLSVFDCTIHHTIIPSTDDTASALMAFEKIAEI